MTDSASPSLSTATCLDKALAIGYGKKVILGRFSAVTADAGSCVDTTVMKDDDDMVRSLAFLKIPDGPLCLVSAGDAKKINVYNIASSEDLKDLSVPATSPCFSFGPHSKRITHLATTSDGIIVFADRFGEVYRLRLSWSPDHHIEPEGSASSPVVFLLQHFSFLTCLFLSSPIMRRERISNTEECDQIFCRRLFTCDKDCHIRCSRFPETYAIEQFLWGKLPSSEGSTSGTSNPSSACEQSIVTAIMEIPSPGSLCHCTMERNSAFHSPASIEGPVSPSIASSSTLMKNTAAGGLDLFVSSLSTCPSHQHQCLDANSYYVLGRHDGCISFWKAKNNLLRSDVNDALEEFCLYTPKIPRSESTAGTEVVQECRGGVVGLSYAIASINKDGCPRHPDDAVQGVFAAHDQSCHVFFIPLLCSSSRSGTPLHVVHAKVSTVELPHPVVALKRCTANMAVVITRESTIHFVELMPSSEVNKSRDLDSQQWKVCVRGDYKMGDLQAAMARMIRAETRRPAEGTAPLGQSMGTQKGEGKSTGAYNNSSENDDEEVNEDMTDSGMKTLDLWAQWKNEVVDPRKRKRKENDGDDEEEEEEEAGEEEEKETHRKKKK